MENGLAIYGSFIKDIKDLIYRRQYEAMKKVNVELIQLYWEIGEEIDRQQCEQGWGKAVVEVLAKELQKEFPGVQGFSARNLWRMRGFYVEYSQNTILPPMGAELDAPPQDSILPPLGAEIHRIPLPPLLAEIGWKKNTVIIEKCKDPLEREFYIRMTKRFGFNRIRGRGSHNIFARDDVKDLVNIQNDNGRAKPYQIKQFLALVEMNRLRLEDDNE